MAGYKPKVADLMSLYYFNVSSPISFSKDDEGTECDSFEAAWISAHIAALEISYCMLRRGENPRDHRIDILGADGVRLADVRFREVLTPNGSTDLTKSSTLVLRAMREIERAQGLVKTVSTELNVTKQRVKEVQQTLHRLSVSGLLGVE